MISSSAQPAPKRESKYFGALVWWMSPASRSVPSAVESGDARPVDLVRFPQAVQQRPV